MQSEYVNWARWHQFFVARSERQLPELKSCDLTSNIPQSVARSLAIFQLGESGGGTVIAQARDSSLPGIDRHYAKAIDLFVAEEHRHAEILAICVRNLGGTLIRKNWTANLFVFARRLMGLRLKVLVLLAAEVVGLCYYHLIATRLPSSRLQSLLAQIVNDERAHLHFHCSFLRTQTRTVWQKRLFIMIWRTTMFFAGIAVLIDHRKALRDLELDTTVIYRRWKTYSLNAEILITGRRLQAEELHSDGPEAVCKGSVEKLILERSCESAMPLL